MSLFLAFALTVSSAFVGGHKHAEAVGDAEAAPGNVAVLSKKPSTFANPINISYPYLNHTSDFNARMLADASIVPFRGEYYLFAAAADGYWWSPDLVNWNFVHCPTFMGWIGNVFAYEDRMYANFHGSRLFVSPANPKKDGPWELVGRISDTLNMFDGNGFVDDDGKVYIYYGSSRDNPLYGGEVDPKNGFKYKKDPVELIKKDYMNHGFENPGANNERCTPYFEYCRWLEGGRMIKHDGLYYFSYLCNQQGSTYATGCYVSDSPLGPFTYIESSPISYKNTGFIRGAANGGIFKDWNGDYWRVNTVCIIKNCSLERRLSLHRVFIEDGRVYSDMAFGDYPQYVLGAGSFEDNRPDWNLLSLNTSATASSSLPGKGPELAFNENLQDWWSASGMKPGDWLMTDLGGVCDVRAIQLNFADDGITENVSPVGVNTLRNNTFCYRYLLEYSLDGKDWQVFANRKGATAKPYKAQDTTHDYFELEKPVKARYVRVINYTEAKKMPKGLNFAISGLRVFGNGYQDPPPPVTGFTIERNPDDLRRAKVEWPAVNGADGYLIRLGTNPDELYNHYYITEALSHDVRILNVGVSYYFTVDSFNNGGVTESGTVKFLP